VGILLRHRDIGAGREVGGLVKGRRIDQLIAIEADIATRPRPGREFGHKGQRQRIKTQGKAFVSQVRHVDAFLRRDDRLQPIALGGRQTGAQKVHQRLRVDHTLAL